MVKLFDCFKFVVRLNASPSSFFHPVGYGFLSELENSPDGVVPFFGDYPVLYPFASAGFISRELRRVGFNARWYPYLFLMIRDSIRAFKSRLQARRDARNKWK